MSFSRRYAVPVSYHQCSLRCSDVEENETDTAAETFCSGITACTAETRTTKRACHHRAWYQSRRAEHQLRATIVRRRRPSATKRPPVLGVPRETWSVPCVQPDERPKLCEGVPLGMEAGATTRALLMNKCRSRTDNKARTTLQSANSLRKDHRSRHLRAIHATRPFLRAIHAIRPFRYQCDRFPIHPPKKRRFTCRSRRHLHTSNNRIAVCCRKRPRWS